MNPVLMSFFGDSFVTRARQLAKASQPAKPQSFVSESLQKAVAKVAEAKEAAKPVLLSRITEQAKAVSQKPKEAPALIKQVKAMAEKAVAQPKAVPKISAQITKLALKAKQARAKTGGEKKPFDLFGIKSLVSRVQEQRAAEQAFAPAPASSIAPQDVPPSAVLEETKADLPDTGLKALFPVLIIGGGLIAFMLFKKKR